MKLVPTATLPLHPLSELVPEMRGEEWAAFLQDVRERGIEEPLRVAQDGRTVLDGRHRLRAAQFLNLPRVPVEPANLGGLTESEYMVRTAVHRRHLSDDQRAVLAARVARIMSEGSTTERARKAAQARWGSDARRPLSTTEHQRQPRTGEQIARSLGVSTYKARKAAALEMVSPDLASKVASGELKLKEAEKEWQRQHNLKLLADTPVPGPGELGQIWTGDFRELGKQIEDESVDLVFTDPPYQESALPLWREMAKLAVRVLKPGGFLIVYTGHLCLPQVFEALGSELDYYWHAIIPFKGPKPSVHARQVRSGFRDVLIYVKPPSTRQPWFFDVVEADKAPDKRFHDWGQSVKPARYFVSRFSLPGEVVLDPFCGAGAFPEAAVLEKRRAIGIEMDPQHAEVARKRVALAEQQLRVAGESDPLQKPFREAEADGDLA